MGDYNGPYRNRGRANYGGGYHHNPRGGSSYAYRPYPTRGVGNQNYNTHSSGQYDEYRGNRYARGGSSFRYTGDGAGASVQVQESHYRNESNDIQKDKPMLVPNEQKAHDFVNEVLSQEGVRGQLIFYMSESDSPANILQNAADYIKIKIQLIAEQEQTFKLLIGSEEFGRGQYANKQLAKQELCKVAYEELQKSCFCIVKKNTFEDINTNEQSQPAEPTKPTMAGSKAYKMLLNMGWGGKGLGVNEQGDEKTVAEQISQNITRGGLGSGDIFGKIKKLLEEFVHSDKLSILRFEPDFTSEDREQIHKVAQRLGLKSKSTGKEPNRRLTVTKKLDRRMLVIQLLLKGCDSESYKLAIPRRFSYKWTNTDDDYDDFDE